MQYLPPPGENEPSPPSVNVPRRGNGARGGIGAIGAAILAFLVKFKLAIFLLFKLLAPSWTFLLSLWIYVALFGWRLAIVLMLVLLAHEFGHYFACRAHKIRASLARVMETWSEAGVA